MNVYGEVRGQQQQEVEFQSIDRRKKQQGGAGEDEEEGTFGPTNSWKLPESSASRHLDLRWTSSGEAMGGGSPEDQSEGKCLWRQTTKENFCLRVAFIPQVSVRLA